MTALLQEASTDNVVGPLSCKVSWLSYVLVLIVWEIVRWVLAGASSLVYLGLVIAGSVAIDSIRQWAKGDTVDTSPREGTRTGSEKAQNTDSWKEEPALEIDQSMLDEYAEVLYCRSEPGLLHSGSHLRLELCIHTCYILQSYVIIHTLGLM